MKVSAMDTPSVSSRDDHPGAEVEQDTEPAEE